ncbi:hypothetical protein [Paenibacillus sp. KS-LC4]|uniref:hypothetical protein n=1 Tax=Paenibacillus sp. KS-LC4 TaxID=2979727 RepID=UPI0030D56199
MGGNRFWEFYLIRYLLGTIFGIVILFFLVINFNDQITAAFMRNPDALLEKFDDKAKKNKAQGYLDEGNTLELVKLLEDKYKIRGSLNNLLFQTTYELKSEDVYFYLDQLGIPLPLDKDKNAKLELTQTGFPILAAIIIAVSGFLYMYFSSMIILVLHGLRYMFFGVWFKKEERTFMVIFWIFFALFLLVTVWIYSINTISNIHFFSALIILSLFIMLFISLRPINKFYERLSKFRKSEGNQRIKKEISISKTSKYIKNQDLTTEVSDYIEAYKHLREHGNAFGIIVCEIVFATWLILWQFSIWAVFYWCLAGFLTWILGSYLEVIKTKETSPS